MALAAPLPTGAVTFAFTDIEGSTVRWERDREAMQEAVRRHDAIVRTAVTEHGGHVFKTMGDAFCVAFEHPEDAVAAMVGIGGGTLFIPYFKASGMEPKVAIGTSAAIGLPVSLAGVLAYGWQGWGVSGDHWAVGYIEVTGKIRTGGPRPRIRVVDRIVAGATEIGSRSEDRTVGPQYCRAYLE